MFFWVEFHARSGRVEQRRFCTVPASCTTVGTLKAILWKTVCSFRGGGGLESATLFLAEAKEEDGSSAPVQPIQLAPDDAPLSLFALTSGSVLSLYEKGAPRPCGDTQASLLLATPCRVAGPSTPVAQSAPLARTSPPGTTLFNQANGVSSASEAADTSDEELRRVLELSRSDTHASPAAHEYSSAPAGMAGWGMPNGLANGRANGANGHASSATANGQAEDATWEEVLQRTLEESRRLEAANQAAQQAAAAVSVPSASEEELLMRAIAASKQEAERASQPALSEAEMIERAIAESAREEELRRVREQLAEAQLAASLLESAPLPFVNAFSGSLSPEKVDEGHKGLLNAINQSQQQEEARRQAAARPALPLAPSFQPPAVQPLPASTNTNYRPSMALSPPGDTIVYMPALRPSGPYGYQPPQQLSPPAALPAAAIPVAAPAVFPASVPAPAPMTYAAASSPPSVTPSAFTPPAATPSAVMLASSPPSAEASPVNHSNGAFPTFAGAYRADERFYSSSSDDYDECSEEELLRLALERSRAEEDARRAQHGYAPPVDQRVVPVPTELVAMVVGKRFGRVHDIEGRTNTVIRVPSRPTSEEEANQATTFVVVEGQPCDVQAAARELTDCVTRLRKKHARVLVDTTSQVSVFVDISNILFGFAGRSLDVNSVVGDLAVRQLAEVVERGRRARARVVAGSFPSASHRMWDDFRACGYEVHLDTRYGGEAFVDECLHAQILRSVARKAGRGEPPRTLILLTGDGNSNDGKSNFPECAEIALENDWNVEVWAWRQATSQQFIRLERKHPGRLSVFFLDTYRDLLTVG